MFVFSNTFSAFPKSLHAIPFKRVSVVISRQEAYTHSGSCSLSPTGVVLARCQRRAGYGSNLTTASLEGTAGLSAEDEETISAFVRLMALPSLISNKVAVANNKLDCTAIRTCFTSFLNTTAENML